jgi:hypothetical protein
VQKLQYSRKVFLARSQAKSRQGREVARAVVNSLAAMLRRRYKVATKSQSHHKVVNSLAVLRILLQQELASLASQLSLLASCLVPHTNVCLLVTSHQLLFACFLISILLASFSCTIAKLQYGRKIAIAKLRCCDNVSKSLQGREVARTVANSLSAAFFAKS